MKKLTKKQMLLLSQTVRLTSVSNFPIGFNPDSDEAWINYKSEELIMAPWDREIIEQMMNGRAHSKTVKTIEPLYGPSPISAFLKNLGPEKAWRLNGKGLDGIFINEVTSHDFKAMYNALGIPQELWPIDPKTDTNASAHARKELEKKINSFRLGAWLPKAKPEPMFETASFHIVKPCNMACKYCYATFDDTHVGPQIALQDAMTIIAKLKGAGLQKITFAGGEPMLYKHLSEIIKYSKKIGLTTSIISNGSLITNDWLRRMRPYLDWVGLSIDSLDPSTNYKIGRKSSGYVDLNFYYELVRSIKHAGFKLKINTVVNAYNHSEDMNEFIKFAKPDRWKVFQALRVEGQNDKQFDQVRIGEAKFNDFLKRHSSQKSLVPENNAAMTGSYLLIDPIGRLFENSSGKHTYSDPLQSSSVLECLKQIKLDREMFIRRGGLYKW